MKTVELHDAFLFMCDDCGKDNFVRAITISHESIDGTEDAAVLDEIAIAFREIVENFRDEDLIFEHGQRFTACPRFVTCQFCNSEFKTFEGDDE